MTEKELREQVALGCRILGANGHDDYVWGHVSVRDPEGRGAWMKASTFGFDEITTEHVILVGSRSPPAATLCTRSPTPARCSSRRTCPASPRPAS